MVPNILLVDDDPRFLELFAMILRMAGYDVSTMSCPVEAELSIGKTPPSLLITDLNMVPMDGVELVRRVRCSRLGAALPTVILTSIITESAVERVRELGPAVLLISKLEMEAILDAVHGGTGVGPRPLTVPCWGPPAGPDSTADGGPHSQNAWPAVK
jgi:DNA-binding response OmpR family regulator